MGRSLLASLKDLWNLSTLDLIEHALTHTIAVQDQLLRLLAMCVAVEVQQQSLDDSLQLLHHSKHKHKLTDHDVCYKGNLFSKNSVLNIALKGTC